MFPFDNSAMWNILVNILATNRVSINKSEKEKKTGKLTITTVRSFGTHWLTPRIQEFMRLNPEIEIKIAETNPRRRPNSSINPLLKPL